MTRIEDLRAMARSDASLFAPEDSMVSNPASLLRRTDVSTVEHEGAWTMGDDPVMMYLLLREDSGDQNRARGGRRDVDHVAAWDRAAARRGRSLRAIEVRRIFMAVLSKSAMAVRRTDERTPEGRVQ